MKFLTLSHKKKGERSKNIQLQKHFYNSWKISISYTSYELSQIIIFTTYGQTLMKIWKTKIVVRFWILLLLLQMSYIFIASSKDLNLLQISTENETFAISFTHIYTSLGMHGLSIWLWHRLPHINVSKSNFWIAESLFSLLQSLTHPVNLSI